MKNHILLKTNALVCIIIIAGFLITALLSYQANYSASIEAIEQVSSLTSEGIYQQVSAAFNKPLNISLTMAGDTLLKELLLQEESGREDSAYIGTIQGYLGAYREKYGYDSVFLVSAATGRYYNFNGLDRVLTQGDPENVWYYTMLESAGEYAMNVDNDEVAGAGNAITLFVNCKIKGADGRVLGVVGVGLGIDYLQTMLRAYQEEFNVNAYCIDGQGVIELSTEHTGYEKVSLFDTGRFSGEARGLILDWKQEQASRFWTADGAGGEKRSYVVTRYLPELDWHLVVERDTDAMVRALHRQLTQTVVVICLIVAGILFIITYVIRNFNGRIVSLTQAVEQERRSVFEQATEELFENIYELDVTHNRPANQATADYFESLGAPPGTPYDRALRIVADTQIKEEFRQGYVDTFSPEHVLRAYEEGGESLRYEFMILGRDGAYYWMRITARIVRWAGDGSVHLLTYRQNIDAEKRRERRILELAQTDEMTGLLTKSATMRSVEEVLRAHPREQYALFIFDIDNFKQANDSFGHAFGDTVIVEFAAMLRANFRREDLLGRIGGDEFLAFLQAPGPDWVREKAAQLCALLRRAHACEGRYWAMSASIGVSMYPTDGEGAEGLYKKADEALYQTKSRGKDGFTLYQE